MDFSVPNVLSFVLHVSTLQIAMTFVNSDALVSRFGRPRRSRVALALSHAISDSRIRPQVVPFGLSKFVGRALADDWFETLLDQEGCRAAWTAYIDATTSTAFPQQLAQGAAPLNGFRHYTIQDSMYLEYYVRVRMGAIGTWDSDVSSADLWAFAATIPEGLSYSTSTISVCENQLGVPATAVEKEWSNGRSQELETSIRNYESVIENAVAAKGNSWLDIHFALLPCIKGYYEIAKALLQNTTTMRNTLYYTLWIEGNADESYVEEYNTFIKNNIGTPTTEEWAHWGEIFKQACINEQNFFNLAIQDYPQYDIVTASRYTICPYVNSATFLYSDGRNVTVSSQAVLWQLINSVGGYSVKLGDGKFLGYDNQKVVIQSDESTKWSINPVFIPGKRTYQLFLSGAIQTALDFGDGSTVSVAKNNATTQTWILTLS